MNNLSKMNLSIKQTLLSFVNICKILCLIFASQTANADATLSYKTNTGIVNLQIKNQQIYVKNIDNATDLLFDQPSNQVTVIQHQKNSFSILNEAELIRINKQLSGLQSAISDNLSPEQHDQLNNILGGLLGSHKEQTAPAYSIKPTSAALVGSFNCQQAQILKDNQGIGHLCTTTASSLQLGPNDFNTLLSLQSFALKAGDIMSDSLNSLSKLEVPNLNHIQFNEFVIFSKINDQPDSHFYLQELDKTTVNAQFSVPAGYQQNSILSSSNLLQ